MSLFKEKKRRFIKKPRVEQTTIDSKHNDRLEYYSDLEKDLPNLKLELDKIEADLDNYSKFKMNELTETQIEKLSLIDRKKEILESIDDAENKKGLK